MNITVINNEQEYQAACKRMDDFLEAHADELDRLPEKADRDFSLLALVIGDYENKNFPLPKADPIEFIKFMMEQKCLLTFLFLLMEVTSSTICSDQI